MRIDLLTPDRQEYQANLHCHTKDCDAGMGFSTPQQIKELYQSRGYSIVAFTNNRLTYHDELNDSSFLALPGMEAKMRDTKTPKIYHFNCFPKHYGAVEDYSFLNWEFSLENANRLIDTFVRNDYLVMYNHPAASFHDSEFHETKEFLDLKGIFAMEIYNNIVENINLTGWSSIYYDTMLRNGYKLWAAATDDNHSGQPGLDSPPDSPYSNYMGGFVRIRAEALTHGCVIDALEKGDFYACAGKNGTAPQIHRMYVEDGVFYADFSPVKSVHLKNSHWHCPHKRAFEDSITHVEFELDPSWTYVRLEIADSNGYKALGNPYFLRNQVARER